MEENKNEYKATLGKALFHLKTILIHKWWVFYYCYKVGLIWEGIIHDLSKFSPAEFIPNIKYVKPGISPIDVQKQEIGYAPAWIHHFHKNPHHYEYWVWNFDKGGYSIRMPNKYAIELICDMMAANKAYNRKNATPETLLKYWNKQKTKSIMHPDTKKFVDTIFYGLYDIWNFEETGGATHLLNIYTCHKYSDIINKSMLNKVYNKIIEYSKNPMQVKIGDLIYENRVNIKISKAKKENTDNKG